MAKRLGIVTGATGQDGSYLCEFLLENDYDVRCLIRRSSYPLERREIGFLQNPRLTIYEGDILDQPSIHSILSDTEAYDRVEVYNLAAQSHVGSSFGCPKYTFEANTNGILNILETVRQQKLHAKYRVYQASTSEMFGKVQEMPQTESTPFYPRSVYGVSKLAAHWLVKNYRESYGIYACSGILFNHESSRRGQCFVTQKVVTSLKKIFEGQMDCLYLGNLDAKRDWGHAKDYIKAMWLMMQQDVPDDYVVATGISHSVREFVEMTLNKMGKDVRWEGEADNEVGWVDGKIVVRVSPEFYRPCEVDILVGDADKIKKIGWKREYDIHSLIEEMIN